MATDLNTTRFNSSPKNLLSATDAYDMTNQALGRERLGASLMPIASNNQISTLASYDPEQALQIQMQENAIARQQEKEKRAQESITSGQSLSPIAIQLRILHSEAIREINKLRTLGYDENQNEMLQVKAKAEDLRQQLAEHGLSFNQESDQINNYNSNFDEASNKAFGLINSAVDIDGDGAVDNIGKINQGLSELAREYNISPKNKRWEGIVKSLTDVKDNISQSRKAIQQDENQAFSESMARANLNMRQEDRKISQDETFSNIFSSVSRLKGVPNDISYRKQALNSILRKESGAAIADSEYSRMMESTLSPKDWSMYLDELTSLESVFLETLAPKAFNAKVMLLSDKYTSRLNPQRLIQYVEDQISPEYYRMKASGGVVPATNSLKKATPKATNNFNVDDF